jgi:hypothetical protein
MQNFITFSIRKEVRSSHRPPLSFLVSCSWFLLEVLLSIILLPKFATIEVLIITVKSTINFIAHLMKESINLQALKHLTTLSLMVMEFVRVFCIFPYFHSLSYVIFARNGVRKPELPDPSLLNSSYWEKRNMCFVKVLLYCYF